MNAKNNQIEKNQCQERKIQEVYYVLLYCMGVGLVDIDLYNNFKTASAEYKKTVEKEFSGIRKNNPQALYFKEKRTSDESVITWKTSLRYEMSMRKGLKSKWYCFKYRHKICHHGLSIEFDSRIVN